MFAFFSQVPRSEAAQSKSWSVRSDAIVNMTVCKQRRKKVTSTAVCKPRLCFFFFFEQIRKTHTTACRTGDSATNVAKSSYMMKKC